MIYWRERERDVWMYRYDVSVVMRRERDEFQRIPPFVGLTTTVWRGSSAGSEGDRRGCHEPNRWQSASALDRRATFGTIPFVPAFTVRYQVPVRQAIQDRMRGGVPTTHSLVVFFLPPRGFVSGNQGTNNKKLIRIISKSIDLSAHH